jgi:hypothetical protein
MFKPNFMTDKLNLLFIVVLLGGLTASCEENEWEETATESMSVVEDATASPLIFTETFEGLAPFYQAHNTGFGKSHSFSVVKSPVFAGKKAGSFKLKASDPQVSDGARAEVTVIKDGVKKEMWYSFAVLLPARGFAFDSQKEIISQWHQMADVHLGEKPQSPATHLIIHQDRFILSTGYNANEVSDGVDPDKRNSFDLGPVTKDIWHSFVFHFIHAYQPYGLIEVWHNGKKVLTHKGGNMYNSLDMPKWKLGVYKWKWNEGDTTGIRKRVLYYDNIKVGNKRATYADMIPATFNNIAPDSDNTHTFINADTEKDIAPVKNGALLIQHALGTKRISIGAKIKDPLVKSVGFMLKGPKDHTYIDNKPPFALFGDDGNGNYYYGGTPLPVGEYAIWITPYFKPNGTAKAGTTFRASFRIKKY